MTSPSFHSTDLTSDPEQVAPMIVPSWATSSARTLKVEAASGIGFQRGQDAVVEGPGRAPAALETGDQPVVVDRRRCGCGNLRGARQRLALPLGTSRGWERRQAEQYHDDGQPNRPPSAGAGQRTRFGGNPHVSDKCYKAAGQVHMGRTAQSGAAPTKVGVRAEVERNERRVQVVGP